MHCELFAGIFSGVKERFIMNKFARYSFRRAIPSVLVGGLALASLSSFAVIDVTAATTGISDAETAVLAVLAAMVTMAAAIYGVKKVLRLLGR